MFFKEDKLVIAVSSSALFNLDEPDQVFRESGRDEYLKYCLQNEEKPLDLGLGFSFVNRLLNVNLIDSAIQPIEVILISKNDANTGTRVSNSIKHYQLPITRMAFTSGEDPSLYIEAFGACLFLSANESDVSKALQSYLPAGLILPSMSEKEEVEEEEGLRIAFDFDGILTDNSSEEIFQKHGINTFEAHEKKKAKEPMLEGPILSFLKKISRLQKITEEGQKYIRTALITARAAPATERVIHTLRHYQVEVDEAFFLGGLDKDIILEKFRPHIFFDDQKGNLKDMNFPMARVFVPLTLG